MVLDRYTYLVYVRKIDDFNHHASIDAECCFSWDRFRFRRCYTIDGLLVVYMHVHVVHVTNLVEYSDAAQLTAIV